MKTLKKFISPIVLFAVLVLPIAIVTTPVLFSTGCTLTQQQTAVQVEYKTLSSVVNLVELSRVIYNDFYKIGRRGIDGEAVKVSQNLDDKVLIIYTEYQRVGSLAINVAKAQSLIANTNVSGSAVDNTNLYLTQLQAVVNHLLDLFNSVPSIPQQNHISIAPSAGV